MDRLGNMEAFVRVVETGSFSETARRLGSSKSLVSRQIAELENELGARLFQRTTRSLTLTEAGRSYHENAARIIADIEQAKASISQLQSAVRGRLLVNAPVSFGTLHLAAALPDFLALYPEVDVEMTLNDRFVDLVDEGFDLGIRIGILPDSSLVARKLAPVRRAVCGSPAYFATHGTPQVPEDLKAHNCLSYSNLALADEWRFIGANGKPKSIEVKGRIRANNGDILRLAALKSHGLVNLPTFIIGGDLQAGALISVLTDYTPQVAGLFAVHPHSRHLSPKVRAFVDFLAERFGPRPYWDLVE